MQMEQCADAHQLYKERVLFPSSGKCSSREETIHYINNHPTFVWLRGCKTGYSKLNTFFK